MIMINDNAYDNDNNNKNDNTDNDNINNNDDNADNNTDNDNNNDYTVAKWPPKASKILNMGQVSLQDRLLQNT